MKKNAFQMKSSWGGAPEKYTLNQRAYGRSLSVWEQLRHFTTL
jgi:hypothetical protein